jgi:hypothetical protein
MAKVVSKIKRIEAVRAMLASGMTRSQVVPKCAKMWAISDSAIDNYIQAASKLIAGDN